MANSQQRSQYWRQLGLQQITKELRQIDQRLQSDSLPLLDRWFWQGRQRELRAAAWLVRGLVRAATTDGLPSTVPASLTVQPPAPLVQTITERIFTPLGRGDRFADNLTGQPLEIDIFQLSQRQKLLQIISQQFQQTLQELQSAQVPTAQLELNVSSILADIWAASLTRFFGRYYVLVVAEQTVEVVPALLADREAITQQMLGSIPLMPQLLGYLLWQQEIAIDNRLQAYDTLPANDYIRDLLANAIIQLANAVVRPFLNRFSDLEPVKQQFYHSNLLATRDIARFRNHLSWHYYLHEKYLQPTAIFESRYDLLVFRPSGIQLCSVYAPRRQELNRLTGLPWFVTMVLEVRDAITPPWRVVTTFTGNVIVYLLTEVIGQGLGLVGRGILQGLGQAWQDRR